MSYYRVISLTNSKHTVAEFGTKTGPSNLRKHLFMKHIKEWSEACDASRIKITGTAALAALKAFKNESGDTLDSEHVPFSQEAFVNAIAEFIIAEDLVSKLFGFLS